MPRSLDELRSFLRARRRALASLIVALMVFNGLLAVGRVVDPATDPGLAAPPSLVTSDDVGATAEATPAEILGGQAPDGAPESIDAASGTDAGGSIPRKAPPTPTETSGGTLPLGVTDDEILVVYYWKGERTETSPYIGGTAAEGQNLDEGLAFRRYVEFINKHAGDGTTFMGVPIDLHGRKLKGIVLEAGNGDFSYAKTAEKIAAEIKPFAAIAAHGSLSTYICPRLAEAGIHNAQTYDLGGLGGTLIERTNGYCLPSGLTFERQIELTIGYLKKQMHEPTSFGQERVYGVIWSAYPGLKDVAGSMIQRLKDAGIPIAADAKLPADLATSQQQAPNIIAQMRNAGVNTLIMPEAGSPLNITHAAQANQYYPDYYVWPCSGEDNTGMVRLFNAAQWDRAEGLTCYDREYNNDAVNNNKQRQTEWWAAYEEIARDEGARNTEPPSPAPLVYAGLYEVIAGFSAAGPDLTVESFRAGLDSIKPYRYDSIEGRTKDPTNMLLALSAPDRALFSDVAYLYWDTTAREAGGATQGAYVYPEDRRYRKPSQF